MRLRNLMTATAVSALTGALAVGALSAPTHALTAPSPAKAGSVVAWGDEGNPHAAAAAVVPEDLTGLVTSVAANDAASAAVTLDGKLHVWGKADEPGSPAVPEVTEAPTGEVTDATAVALTAQNGAVLRTNGAIRAWGNSTPLSDVPSDLRAKAIALQGGGTGYAVRTDGTLATWGLAPSVAPPAGLTGLTDVSASFFHVVALHADGTIDTWGFGIDGLYDVPDFGGKKVVKVAAGYAYSAAVLDDGSLKIWGPGAPTVQTFDGQTPATKVVDVSLFSIADNGAAVTADGAVHAWGSNTHVTTVPESLSGQPVSAVAVGSAHAVAIVTTFRDLTKPTVAGTPIVGSDPDRDSRDLLADAGLPGHRPVVRRQPTRSPARPPPR